MKYKIALLIYVLLNAKFHLQTLMREVEDYQPKVDEVQATGRHIIETNRGIPQLGRQIETQLSNLEDSYLSLQATGIQIKVSHLYLFSCTWTLEALALSHSAHTKD